MEKKPRITIFLTDDEYEAVKAAAKCTRRTVRNYAESAVLLLAMAECTADKEQGNE